MAKQIPEPLVRIRNKYPVARCAKEWAQIVELASSGDSDKIIQAEALAHQCATSTPRMRVRQAGFREARARRNDFLRAQKRLEQEMLKAFRGLGDTIGAMLLRRSNDAGIIPIGRSRKTINLATLMNRDAYKAVNRIFMRGLRGSAKMGVKSAQSQAQTIVKRAKSEKSKAKESDFAILVESFEQNLKEHYSPYRGAKDKDTDKEQDKDQDQAYIIGGIGLLEVDPLKAKIDFGTNSTIFKRLFKGTLRQTMAAGLFGDTGISNRIWDLRDENRVRIRRQLASGIARGDSAAKMSRDIRGLLHQPNTLRGFARATATPGRGVYRSAYKNALRLTRTETNRAFTLADVGFAAEKEWKLIWVVSGGQREFDSCDTLAARSSTDPFTPEEFASNYPQHPHDLCYSVLVPTEPKPRKLDGFPETKGDYGDYENDIRKDVFKKLPPKHFSGITSIEYPSDEVLIRDYRFSRKEMKSTLGFYFPEERMITINKKAAMRIGKLEAQKTLTHEIGHDVYLKQLKKNTVREFAAAEKAQGSFSRVTSYAHTNTEEHFSETYAAYVHDSGRLQQMEPEVYTFMKNKIFDGKEFFPPTGKGAFKPLL